MTKHSYISIDYGTHKSWLAYSVENFCFAYKTLPTRELLDFLPSWIEERRPDIIVIGMPYNIDGTESIHCKRVRKFAIELEKNFPTKKIVLHDERLTTSEARFGGVEDIDAESARLILEEYIESHS